MSEFVIYAHSGEYARLYQVATLAASAAANGDEVHVILFFDALRRFVDDDLDGPLAPPSSGEDGRAARGGARHAGARSVGELVDSARRLGKLTLYACAAQPRLMNLSPEDVADVVDQTISLPDFMRKTQRAETKLFI